MIASIQNSHFKRWRSLLKTKGIRHHQQCLVLGKRVIKEVLTNHSSLCRELLFTTHDFDLPQLPSHSMPIQISSELFRELDITGTSFPILICDTPPLTRPDLTIPPQGLEVLCPLGDPTNLGTLVRSCMAFGVQKLILLQEAAHPFHPKTIRASSGTVFNQTLYQGPEIIDLCKPETSRWIVALDVKGENLSTWQWPRNIRVLVGEEGLGLPEGKFHETLTISQAKGLDSLNATTAMSIALFTYRQQLPL